MSSDEELARVVAEVPQDVKQAAKDKLDYGGISQVIRDRLTEVAYGADLQQRTRLERRRDELKRELTEQRQRRREAAAEIETIEEKIQNVNETLSSLDSKEDRYEAKLEEIEARLRGDGIRFDSDHPAVKRAASAGGRDPDGVIKDLKERNPDVPDYAFQQGIHDAHQWNGVPEHAINLDVSERENEYREGEQ